MIDFESRLSTLLDDAAASMHPHPDPDSVFLPMVVPTPSDVHRFRPTFAAVAAAGIVLLGGSAFAMERLTNDPPKRVTSADTPVTETVVQPTTTAVEATSTTTAEVVTTLARVPEIKPAVVVEPTVPRPEPTAPPTVPSTIPATVPATVPPAPPVVVEFTAKLGANGLAKNPMEQGFYGNAQPGSAIRVASPYGVAETTANGDGKWETTLKMLEVPPGTNVAVRITSNTSDRVREFSLLRPAPAAPATIEFTAKLGADGQANTPMTQGFVGTAQPGSAIRVGSEWGVAETQAGPNGNWEATLVMTDVPPGTTVAVRITSNTSDRVREFTLHRPGEPTPPFVAFTASAAQTTTDHTPPVNEYWGTSTAGAVISITSDYGSTQVASNAEGHWSARLEFPDAPLGVTFNVHITSSKGEAVYDFQLTRVGPG
jgi:hypothetical protein